MIAIRGYYYGETFSFKNSETKRIQPKDIHYSFLTEMNCESSMERKKNSANVVH